jgi:cobalt-zinc-cadmium efflux system outer membrane protein
MTAVLLVAVSTGTAGAQAAAGGAPMTLAQLEQMALSSNPTTTTAMASREAASSRARQAGAWPNPIVGYSAEELGIRKQQDPRGEHGVFVEQMIPLGGKLRLDRAVFERAIDEADAVIDLQRLRIITSVRTLYYQVLAAERRVEVQQRMSAHGAETVAVLAQLFNVGAADRPDFLEAEIAARRVQLKTSAARNEVYALRQQLASVVGSAAVATAQLAGTLDESIPELERDPTVTALMEKSPRLRAARAAVDRARAVSAVARRATYPDLFVRGGAEYNREHAEGSGRPLGWQGEVEAGISIPLFNRNQGGVAAARAEESVAETELRRVELSLRAMAAAEFASYLTAIRGAEAYRAEMLPAAEEAYRLYLARYREMGAAYPQVLSAQRTLFELSDEYLESLDAAWRSALRLQGMLAGEGLESPAGLDGDGDMVAMQSGRER